MKNKKAELQKHVISAMRRDDGYIIAEAKAKGVQYVVYVRTTEGYKPLCTVPVENVQELWREGIIEHGGDGKWKLTEKGKED